MSKNVYEMVTDRIIEQLESGVIPWEKPWTGEIKKSVDTLWRRDGRLKVMKNIDEMLNEIGE